MPILDIITVVETAIIEAMGAALQEGLARKVLRQREQCGMLDLRGYNRSLKSPL